MFKGYVKTNGKIPQSKIKAIHEFSTLNDMLLENCDYGGVLRDDIIMVDIDDSNEANKLLKIILTEKLQCNILKTSRGYHFYFKNSKITKNKIHTKISLGITADFKLGSKNTVVPLKVFGEIRTFINEVDVIEEIPFWLFPMSSAKNLANSQCRNSDLFSYILILQSANFKKAEIITIITIINNYILDDPLPKNELDIIIREEAFSKPVFFLGTVFQHHVFAKWLINTKNIIKIHDDIYFYKDDNYMNRKNLYREMLDEIPSLKSNQRKEIMSYLEDYIIIDKEPAPVKYISLKNGIFNIDSEEIIPHNPNILITNKVDIEYKKIAYSEIVDITLNKISGQDMNLRLLLEEMVGYCLLRRNELGKFFILIGDGGCGKSTFLDMLAKMLGETNISSVTLQNLDHSFLKTDIVGTLANIGDDIGDKYIDDNSTLYKLVTGESIQFQHKFEKPFKFRNYSKLLFASNNLPKMNDLSGALSRRLVIVPFKTKFVSTKDYDPYIGDKLLTQNSMEYLLRIGIEGLQRVLKNKRFTECESVSKEMNTYEEYNNSILGYIAEGGKFENESVSDSYKRYGVWCLECGIKPLQKNKVSRELSVKFNLKSQVSFLDSKSVRIYKKEDSHLL